MKKRIIFWGAGHTGERYVRLHRLSFSAHEIIGVIDSNPAKRGGRLKNLL